MGTVYINNNNVLKKILGIGDWVALAPDYIHPWLHYILSLMQLYLNKVIYALSQMDLTRLVMYSVVSVCLCVISLRKQDISKTNLWIFVKFIADTSYILSRKWLTFGADHIRDKWERIIQNSQFSYGPFHKRHKRRPLVNHIILTVDHESW